MEGRKETYVGKDLRDNKVVSSYIASIWYYEYEWDEVMTKDRFFKYLESRGYTITD